MAFQMYGDAILTRDVPESGLRAGDIGMVVELHVVPGVAEEGYSVEFFDMTGNTVAVVTLPASALRTPTPADPPHRASPQRLTHELSRNSRSTSICTAARPARLSWRKRRLPSASFKCGDSSMHGVCRD